MRAKTEKDKKIVLQVTEPNELMKFLISELPGKSRNNIKSLLAHGQILLEQEIVSQYNHLLEAGQEVIVNLARAEDVSHLQGLKILFEDAYIIVVEKPAGLLSVSSDTEKEQTAHSVLSAHLKRANPKSRVFVVHRLDRETSGVMMFAKSQEIQRSLQDDWKKVVLERSYIVVVEGIVTKEQDTITSWLKQSKTLKVYSCPTPNDGQKAVTQYKRMKQSKKYSMLEARLETGRKNQIRVHMQDIGHSIIGDKKYGATTNPIKRLGLHARVLAFKHPINGEEVHIETEIPKGFLGLFS